jgi:osmotically-inducible protein OsmY
MKTDNELQKAVHDELLFEPAVTATDIGITAKNGVVSLVGTVKSYAEKWAAERAAERVIGMHALAKELKVKLPTDWRRSDEDIAAAGLSALKWDVQVPEDRITAEVEDGFVTLKGTVDWDYQRQAAARDVRQLTGVINVTNEIKLAPKASPEQVRTKIESALQRSACSDARRIKVDADGGRVTLTGEVHSWAEREDAERAAWSTPGVVVVYDEIRVQA